MDEYGVEVAVEVDVGERVFCLEVVEPAHKVGDYVFRVSDRYKTSKMTKDKRGRGVGGAWEGRGRA